MKIEKYAAIDIGSNAIRVLIANIVIPFSDRPVQFQKNALVRVPIRLGEDSFSVGEISKKNIKRMLRAMKAFKQIMKVHGVTRFRAYATSALREATNGEDVVAIIKKETGVKIEIIDGKKEASVISNTQIFDQFTTQKTVLYVDVGGGSTELSILKNGERIHSRSFKLGTVRLLNKTVEDRIWDEIQKWITKKTAHINKITVLGSGGNINKLFKLTNTKEGKPLSLVTLNSIYARLQELSYEDRILEYQLNQDRADVILPATEIYLRTLQWAGASRIYVPKIGLADGMIKEMYYDLQKKINHE
jgi:exopolyphosphatase/guanosine-5'-triphosphate,3'-diphosphate pyrophosphatase